MTINETKEQLQEDVLSILEGFGVDEALTGQDYSRLANALCETIVLHLNKLNQ